MIDQVGPICLNGLIKAMIISGHCVIVYYIVVQQYNFVYLIVEIYHRNKNGIVIVITYYSPSCLGQQETAKELFGLRVKLPNAHLFTTYDRSLILILCLLNVKQESCEYQFSLSLVWSHRESNPILPFQQQTRYPLNHWSVKIKV